jgi:dTDP-glucose pyrophosphorylase
VKKPPNFDNEKTYIVTLKFIFKGEVMDKVAEKISKKEEIKLTHLNHWFVEEKYEARN